jgi:superfamily II DNA/RNA helicase
LHSNGVYDATYIHSDRLQSHREQALAEFKEGKYRILIATDVAARGIHVDAVAHVVNFDLPLEPEDYVHRIGRTGRAGATGKATTFVTPRDRGLLKQIEKLIGFRLGSAAPAAAPGEAPVISPVVPVVSVENTSSSPQVEAASQEVAPVEAQAPVAPSPESKMTATQASRFEEKTAKSSRKNSRRERDQKRREQRDGHHEWESETRRYAFPVDDIPPGVKSNGPVTALSVISLDSHDGDDLDEAESDVSSDADDSQERSKVRSKKGGSEDRSRRRKRRRRSGRRPEASATNSDQGNPPTT